MPLRWTIGRNPAADLMIAGDPYVAMVNCHVERVGRDFVLRDSPGSPNGTALNGRRLAAGARATLRDGDIIGVGRTSILFTDA